MPRIENASAIAVKEGTHSDFGPNTILIQITDPASTPPTPKQSFKTTHHFEFLDIEKNQKGAEEFGITKEQASSLITILKKALEDNDNVIVHCTMGLCRSGAVVEVGTILGFEDTPIFRAPNLMVKHALMKELGLTYDANEQHYCINMELTEDLIFISTLRSTETTN